MRYFISGFKPSGRTVVKTDDLGTAFRWAAAFGQDPLVRRVSLMRR